MADVPIFKVYYVFFAPLYAASSLKLIVYYETKPTGAMGSPTYCFFCFGLYIIWDLLGFSPTPLISVYTKFRLNPLFGSYVLLFLIKTSFWGIISSSDSLELLKLMGLFSSSTNSSSLVNYSLFLLLWALCHLSILCETLSNRRL